MISLQRFASSAVGTLVKAQPLSPGKVRFAWWSVVGDAIHRASSISLDTDGTLHVEVTGPLWRPEIERASPMILGRLASLLGPGIARRIVVRVAGERPARVPRRAPLAATLAGRAGRPA